MPIAGAIAPIIGAIGASGGAIPAAIGAAGTIGGALLGRGQAGSATGAGRGLTQAAGQTGLNYGNQFLGQGASNLAQTGNFYRTLMSGNLQQISQLLGPEISQIGQQYNNLAQSSAQLQPRGGLTASARSAIPFEKEATIGNAIMGAPLAGAQGLYGVGGAQTGAGQGLFNTAAGAGSALGNIGLGISGQGLQGAAGGYTLGNNFAAAQQQIPWGQIFGGAKSPLQTGPAGTSWGVGTQLPGF